MTELPNVTVPLTAEQRHHLEELYRLQIGSVKSLARLLGYPCPIVGREERKDENRRDLAHYGILKPDNR